MTLYAQKRRALAKLVLHCQIAPADIAIAWRLLHRYGFRCAARFVRRVAEVGHKKT